LRSAASPRVRKSRQNSSFSGRGSRLAFIPVQRIPGPQAARDPAAARSSEITLREPSVLPPSC
jgi:hypothetical protein